MKNDLVNMIQGGSTGFGFGDKKGSKKSTRANQQEIQFQIGITFNEVCQLFDEYHLRMPIDVDGLKAIDKIHGFKVIVQQLLQRTSEGKAVNEDSNVISCPDCQTYQASLQKLENDVRQHIRLQQQLKIFQDTQEQKIDQIKKEKKDAEKKMEHYKKQHDEFKKQSASVQEKLHKLEHDNDHYKKQIRDLKRTINNQSHQEPLHSKRQSHKQSAYAYDSKQNKSDWGHRNGSVRRDEKEKGYERKSIEKRNDSAEKNWRMSNNAKSNKMISIMNDKMIHDKTKDERRKVIQSKFDYRR